MRIQRTLPPAAASLSMHDLLHGLAGIFVGKKQLTRLEAEVRDYFHVKHVFFVSSGKAALTLILDSLKSLSSRRRVLIPAYTCFSVPSAIVKAGLDVSLCDVDPKTLDFNYECLAESLDESILCVVPTHLLGLPSDVDRVKALCKEKEVFVVEDSAQAMGVRYKERLLGTIGDVSFFSLGRGKNITCGSGGIILTNSDPIARAIRVKYAELKRESALRVMRNLWGVLGMRLLINPLVYWLPTGLPFLKLGETKFYRDFPMHRMDGLKAGLLTHWRERLEQSNKVRLLAAKELINRLAPISQVIRPPSSEKTIYLRLPLMMENEKVKEKLCALSKESGLGISPLYPTAIQAIKDLKHSSAQKGFPASAMVAERLVTLPVHHLVRLEDQEKIYNVFASLHKVTAEDSLRSPIRGLNKDSASARA